MTGVPRSARTALNAPFANPPRPADEASFLRQMEGVRLMVASGYELTVLPLLTPGRRVRVSAVPPGPCWTPLQVSGGQLPDKLVNFGHDTPLGRPGQPVEIAPVYVLLASAEATDVTGQVYGASGGRGVP